MSTVCWLSHNEVLVRLQVSVSTLRRLMRATPSEVESPWVCLGTKARPVYRWDKARVDDWFKEVTKWRASKSEEKATESDGETQTEQPVRGKRQASRSRASSSKRSKRQKLSGESGSLPPLAQLIR